MSVNMLIDLNWIKCILNIPLFTRVGRSNNNWQIILTLPLSSDIQKPRLFIFYKTETYPVKNHFLKNTFLYVML